MGNKASTKSVNYRGHLGPLLTGNSESSVISAITDWSEPSDWTNEIIGPARTPERKCEQIRIRRNEFGNLNIFEQNKAAAKWRVRKQVRRHRFDRLNKLGTLAVIAAGSLLHWEKTPGARHYESFSRWKPTLEGSPLWDAIDVRHRSSLTRSDFQQYKRIETALRTVGQMLCLATEDLEDRDLIRAWSKLKVWAVSNGMGDYQDNVLNSLKWLGKAAQAVFLQGTVPDEEEVFYIPRYNNIILPFDGPLRFISDLLNGDRDRSSGLTLSEGRALAQIGSIPRAMPYPSREQVLNSVKGTMELLSAKKKPIAKRSLKTHRKSLEKLIERCDPSNSNVTHISLSNSGSYEQSRLEGGRSGYLLDKVKRYANLPVTEENLAQISGRIDCFGHEVISPVMGVFALMLQRRENVELSLGDISYVEAADVSRAVNRRMEDTDHVPMGLARLLVNVSSLSMLEYGTYDKAYSTDLGILTFDRDSGHAVFSMTQDYFPVKGSLSIEAGMKVRLVTAAPAALTQIGQMLSNKARSVLSVDPFMRTGFQEADKLWEVLKTYGKLFSKGKI